MIELGLSRISKLLERTALKWKAVHVAGTNGKGSICAYTSAMLKDNGVRCGRYTSPHLITPRDCISIDGRTVRKSVFDTSLEKVKQRNRELQIRASEFEILTATAFEIFNVEDIEIGVVEVGMGGRLDATNVLSNVLVSVISKIGLDHQSFLGNTISEIAREKAGILRPSVPCVVDGTNPRDAIDAIVRHAEEVKTALSFVSSAETGKAYDGLSHILAQQGLQPHQEDNLCCAVEAFARAMDRSGRAIDWKSAFHALEAVRWPGRLQHVQINLPDVALEEVLVDGAHNTQSAEVLATYVDRKLRTSGANIVWVMAVSNGKNVHEMLGSMARPGDSLFAVPFSPVEGMPWVQPLDTAEILEAAHELGHFKDLKIAANVSEGLKCAADLSTASGANARVVVAGSLYLVSDFFRLLGVEP